MINTEELAELLAPKIIVNPNTSDIEVVADAIQSDIPPTDSIATASHPENSLATSATPNTSVQSHHNASAGFSGTSNAHIPTLDASSSPASCSSTPNPQCILTREEEGYLVIFRVWAASQIINIHLVESEVPIRIPLVKAHELATQIFGDRIYGDIYQVYDNIRPLFIPPATTTIKAAFAYLSQRIRTIEDIVIFMEQLLAGLTPLAKYLEAIKSIPTISMYSKKIMVIKRLMRFYERSIFIEPINFPRLIDQISKNIMNKRSSYYFEDIDEAHAYIIINKLTDKFGSLHYPDRHAHFTYRRLSYITAALTNPLNAITHTEIEIDNLDAEPGQEIMQFADALLHRYCGLEHLTLTWRSNYNYRLSWRYNGHTAGAIIAALAQTLTQASCPLRRLRLVATNDGTLEESALVALAKALPASQLTHLILEAPALSEIAMDAMAKAMTDSPCPLKVWALRLEWISDENTSAIAAVLALKQEKLSHLVTKALLWGEQGIGPIVNAILQENGYLSKWSLTMPALTEIDTAAIVALLTTEQDKQLLSLMINSEGVGLVTIAHAIASPSCYLRQWTLVTPELTSLHIDAIITMMTSPTGHLEDFKLITGNTLGERGIAPFAAALTHPNCHLKNWSLVLPYDEPQPHYQLSDTDIQAIVQAATAPNGPENLSLLFLAVNRIDWLVEVLLHTHCRLARVAIIFYHPDPITALDALLGALRINTFLIDLSIEYNLGAIPLDANGREQEIRRQLEAEIELKIQQLYQLIEENKHNKLLKSLNLQQLAWLKAKSSGEDLSLLPTTASVEFSKFQAKAIKNWGIFNKTRVTLNYPIATISPVTLAGLPVEASKPAPCL